MLFISTPTFVKLDTDSAEYNLLHEKIFDIVPNDENKQDLMNQIHDAEISVGHCMAGDTLDLLPESMKDAKWEDAVAKRWWYDKETAQVWLNELNTIIQYHRHTIGFRVGQPDAYWMVGENRFFRERKRIDYSFLVALRAITAGEDAEFFVQRS